MSPYSSVMRSSVWGGIPISLPAMSVFAFLAFWALWLVLRGRQSDRARRSSALAATGVPVLASLVMGYISLVQLDAACKLCIGIYLSSATAFVAALLLWLDARRVPAHAEYAAAEVEYGVLGLAFGLGVLFVVLPVTTYAMSAPPFERYAGTCGQLRTRPTRTCSVPFGPQERATQMIEVLDPLCPSCKRLRGALLAHGGRADDLAHRALLFPLDNQCNWMVSDAIHPGACAISEAMLCAGSAAQRCSPGRSRTRKRS